MGFNEHLRFAERTMRKVQDELALGIQLGIVLPDEVQEFIMKDEELRKRVSSILRGTTLAANGPIFFAK